MTHAMPHQNPDDTTDDMDAQQSQKQNQNQNYDQALPSTEDIWLTLEELICHGGQERDWVLALIEENIIECDAPSARTSAVSSLLSDSAALFSGYQLARLRRASRIRRDFEASAAAVGLIMDLLDEVEHLRQCQRLSRQRATVVEIDWYS